MADRLFDGLLVLDIASFIGRAPQVKEPHQILVLAMNIAEHLDGCVVVRFEHGFQWVGNLHNEEFVPCATLEPILDCAPIVYKTVPPVDKVRAISKNSS